MDYKPFYEICESLPKSKKAGLKTFKDDIETIFDDVKSDQYKQEHKIVRLFTGAFKGVGVSRSQYFSRKPLVRMFYDWLYQQGVVPKETVEYVYGLTPEDILASRDLTKFYFKNLGDALNAIEFPAQMYACKDEDSLLCIKSIVILLWHGVPVSQMISIKKEDLDFESKTVCIRNAEDTVKNIQLEEQYFQIICDYSRIDGHKAFPSGLKHLYMQPSMYLFRAYRTNRKRENLCEADISAMIQRFNELCGARVGKKFGVKELRNNGMMYDLYCRKIETQTDRIKYLQKEYSFSYTTARSLNFLYEVWIQEFGLQ